MPPSLRYDYPATWAEIGINRYGVVNQDSPPPEHAEGVASPVDRLPTHPQLSDVVTITPKTTILREPKDYGGESWRP